MTNKQNNWKLSFFTIWAGQAVSLFTSAVLQLALIWYLTAKTGSAMVLSMATLVGFLPQAILGPFIGVLVDRWNRKLVMIGADLTIALAGGLLAVLAHFTQLSAGMVLAVLLLRSVGTALHAPALGAVTPLLVPEDKLVKCSGYSSSIQTASYLLGPAAAAFLYSVWELNSIILLDIFGAVVASAAVVLVHIPKTEPTQAAQAPDFFGELREGYRILRQDRGLSALLWVGALYMAAFMPINALFPLMSMVYFGGTPAHASAAEIAFAAGMLAGSLLLGVWGGFRSKTATMTCSILLMGLALTVSGLLPASSFIAFACLCVLMGFSAPFYGSVQTALFQERISPEYLGRAFGLLGSIMSLAMPLGLLCSSLFADRIGVNRWFLLSGLVTLVTAVLCYCIPSIRHLGRKEQ